MAAGQDISRRGENDDPRRLWAICAAILLATLIAIVDTQFRKGVAVGQLHITVILVLFPWATARDLIAAAWFCSILTIGAFFISAEGRSEVVPIVNRAFSLFIIWATAILCIRYKRSRAMFELAVEASPDAMVVSTIDGHITFANARVHEVFGYAPEELIGMEVDQLVPMAARPKHARQRATFWDNPKMRRMGDVQNLTALRKDGDEIPVEIGISPIRGPQGMVVVSSIVDISQRRINEQQLKAYASELESRNRELDEFSYMASHDLQEPLRKLSAFSELLRRDIGGDIPKAAVTDLRFIEDAAARMRDLIQDLLALSRAGKSEIQPGRVPLRDCVREALELHSARIQKAGALVRVPDDLPSVYGDRTLIIQLLQNLLGNALKYAAEGRTPEIGITAESMNGEMVFGVRDNGIGIKPEHFDRIFEPFRRLHSRKSYAGTGIGLAICRKVVARHGGRIWVESKFGEGSHFRFTLGNPENTQTWPMQTPRRNESVAPPSSSSTTTPATVN